MLRNYFKIAIRNLARNKIYSFINIIGLSLGLTCAMLIILYTKDEVSYDRFHKNANNLYRIIVERTNPDGSDAFSGGSTGFLQGPKFKESIPEIKSFVRIQSEYREIKKGTEIIGQEMLSADSNFFSLFSFPLLSGNSKTALLDPKSVVISEEIARLYFGTPDALGKTILFKSEDRFEPYTVSGVAKKSPQNSSIKFEFLIPLIVLPDQQQNNENWFNFHLNSFLALAPGADTKMVEAKMKRVYEADAKETIRMAAEKYGDKATTTHLLQPFTNMHLNKDYRADNGLSDASSPMYSYILSGIAAFILLIACVNFINLTIARSLKRAKEIGVRKVVGSNRKQLIIQFLGESFLLCAGAFLFAVVLAAFLLPAFNQLSNKNLSISYLIDANLVIGYFLLLILTGLLAGFYPALIISKYSTVHSLYNRFRLSGKNYLQKSLVVLQFALTTILIIATLMIYSQFDYLTTKELGYDDSNMIVISKSGLSHSEAKLLKEELMKNPDITGVAPKNGGSWGTVANINGENKIEFAYETINEAYLPLYKIPVVKGRNFSPEFPSDSTHSVLVNETFVKKAGWKEPIGQIVDFWYQHMKYTVVGVVKDHHYESLSSPIGPQLFTMKPDNSFGLAFIRIRPGSEASSLKHIERTFKRMFPINPYSYKFKDKENLMKYESEAKWKQMMLFGAILTIFISCIGLFGLSVLSAEKRTKEIGIRKVLGASVSVVIATLSKDFLKLVAIALFIAIPVAWLLTNKWLQTYPYRIEPGWQMFVMAGVMILLIALLTVSYQAIKAAVANPVKSLRTE